MGYSIARMTIYALICAIEEDLRCLLRESVNCGQLKEEKIPLASIETWQQRFLKENSTNIKPKLEDLISYLDIGDTFQIINAQPGAFSSIHSSYVKSITKNLEKIIPIRNRVMHIRPLAFEDTSFITEFSKDAAKKDQVFWKNLQDVIGKIDGNPSFVLDLEIPVIDEDIGISHNLPLPDFDETGLIGREDQVKKLKKLCEGPYPVISIVGEGGIGKSALALKVAYELLEDKNSPFDAIIWVSSKTTQITASEIRDIKGAISTSLGLFSEISTQLSGVKSENPLEEILDYLSSFRIALFIDNLETILDIKVREFMESLPVGSKVIITSRIGLGAFEVPVKLLGIEEQHAAQLLRTLAKSRDVEGLSALPDAVVRKFCQRMHCNPAYIKWFVSTIQTGKTPEEILQNSGKFLDFCMTNVYDYLSLGAREFLAVMQCAAGWHDITEIAYLGDINAINAQRALQELMTTHMIAESSRVMGTNVKTTYQLSELARAYLNKTQKPAEKIIKKVKGNRNKLNAIIENSHIGTNDRYSPYNISTRSKFDRVIAKKLFDCLGLIRSEDYAKAIDILDDSTRLAPDYFEVARIRAYLNTKTQNFSEARENYELALQLAPGNSQLLFWYANFLSRDLDENEEALSYLEEAHSYDKAPVIKLALTRLYLFDKQFEKAEHLLNDIRNALQAYGAGIQKKYYDLQLQLDYRKADNFYYSELPHKTVEHLILMMETYNSIPSSLIDNKMREKVGKSKQTIESIRNSREFSDDPQVRKLVRWEYDVKNGRA